MSLLTPGPLWLDLIIYLNSDRWTFRQKLYFQLSGLELENFSRDPPIVSSFTC